MSLEHDLPTQSENSLLDQGRVVKAKQGRLFNGLERLSLLSGVIGDSSQFIEVFPGKEQTNLARLDLTHPELTTQREFKRRDNEIEAISQKIDEKTKPVIEKHLQDLKRQQAELIAKAEAEVAQAKSDVEATQQKINKGLLRGRLAELRPKAFNYYLEQALLTGQQLAELFKEGEEAKGEEKSEGLSVQDEIDLNPVDAAPKKITRGRQKGQNIPVRVIFPDDQSLDWLGKEGEKPLSVKYLELLIEHSEGVTKEAILNFLGREVTKENKRWLDAQRSATINERLKEIGWKVFIGDISVFDQEGAKQKAKGHILKKIEPGDKQPAETAVEEATEEREELSEQKEDNPNKLSYEEGAALAGLLYVKRNSRIYDVDQNSDTDQPLMVFEIDPETKTVIDALFNKFDQIAAEEDRFLTDRQKETKRQERLNQREQMRMIALEKFRLVCQGGEEGDAILDNQKPEITNLMYCIACSRYYKELGMILFDFLSSPSATITRYDSFTHIASSVKIWQSETKIKKNGIPGATYQGKIHTTRIDVQTPVSQTEPEPITVQQDDNETTSEEALGDDAGIVLGGLEESEIIVESGEEKITPTKTEEVNEEARKMLKREVDTLLLSILARDRNISIYGKYEGNAISSLSRAPLRRSKAIIARRIGGIEVFPGKDHEAVDLSGILAVCYIQKHWTQRRIPKNLMSTIKEVIKERMCPVASEAE